MARYGDLVAREQRQDSLSRQHSIYLPINGFVETDGTALAAFADGASATPGWELTGSEAWGIRWNNHANPDPVAQSILIPERVNPNQDIVVHVLAAKTGATLADAVTFTCQAFFQSVGALYDADADAGGASSAMTGDATAKTVQEVTLTIDSDDVPSVPSVLTLTIQPTDGTLDTDDVVLLAVWLEYTPQLLTA